jgi:hypothetical protein
VGDPEAAGPEFEGEPEPEPEGVPDPEGVGVVWVAEGALLEVDKLTPTAEQSCRATLLAVSSSSPLQLV